MVALEPTDELLRVACSGGLYLDMDHKRFQVRENYATVVETNALCAAQDAGLIDMGDEGAWVRLGAGPLIRQMVATDAGRAWLAEHDKETTG